MSPIEPRDSAVQLNATALRVLAHPLRSRLLSALRKAGPATATDLAARLGTNSGATSYHLRKLESVGLVADTEQGEGRRRLWRATTSSHRWRVSDFAGDEDAETALNWLVRDYSRHLGGNFENWLDVEESWPLDWREALGLGDTTVTVTAEQLTQLKTELGELLSRYRFLAEGDPQARSIVVYSVLFPRDVDAPPKTQE